jgi:hypothetical protein
MATPAKANRAVIAAIKMKLFIIKSSLKLTSIDRYESL